MRYLTPFNIFANFELIVGGLVEQSEKMLSKCTFQLRSEDNYLRETLLWVILIPSRESAVVLI
jgi:hypothetical protein